MNIFMMLRKILVAGTVLLFMLGANTSSVLFAIEHPGKKVKEKSEVTLEDVAIFAEEYVQKNSEDGVFKHYDKNTEQWLELTLDKVHRERLSRIKKNEYFVCADFKGKDGKMYDIDFFVSGKDKSKLKVDKKSIAVHKVNGKEYYTWNYNEKKDVWEKKAIKAEKKQPEHPKPPEHPEHPK